MVNVKTELPEYAEPPCWKVSPPDFSEFLRRLSHLVPDGSILCLDGIHDPSIEAYLRERPAAYDNETNQGFLKLRSKVFYMPITEENLQGFAALSETYAEPEICNDLRVYRNDRIVLSWHDLPSDPIYVVKEIDEFALREFCEATESECVFDAEAV